MQVGEKLHAKRTATEDRIRALEAAGEAGDRFTATMPNAPFMALGLVSDIGWLLQLVFGGMALAAGVDARVTALVAADLCLIVAGVAVTVYLGVLHEKEIALRWQRDLSFGLVALGGIVGILAGVLAGSAGLVLGSLLNTAGSLPLYLSFRKGIIYGIR